MEMCLSFQTLEVPRLIAIISVNVGAELEQKSSFPADRAMMINLCHSNKRIPGTLPRHWAPNMTGVVVLLQSEPEVRDREDLPPAQFKHHGIAPRHSCDLVLA